MFNDFLLRLNSLQCFFKSSFVIIAANKGLGCLKALFDIGVGALNKIIVDFHISGFGYWEPRVNHFTVLFWPVLQIKSTMQRFLFWCLNTSENRKILNRWKAEGRLPENYCGSLQEISPAIEDECRRENHKPFPEPVPELYRAIANRSEASILTKP
jgi:hypothetical protein